MLPAKTTLNMFELEKLRFVFKAFSTLVQSSTVNDKYFNLVITRVLQQFNLSLSVVEFIIVNNNSIAQNL